MAAAPADGRTARSERTRAAVLDALERLVAAGDTEPGARRIADAAGVSVRSVFAHFASLDDLHAALVARVRDQVLARLRPIGPARPLPERIAELCAQRARIAEELGAFRRAAGARAVSSAPLAEARRASAVASRQQVERVFATELARFDGRERARRRAAVDAAVSGETWDLLRGVHELSPQDAEAAMAGSVAALLAPAAGAEAVSWRQEADAALGAAADELARLRAALAG
jgi:AcrR family transcriptional regulator